MSKIFLHLLLLSLVLAMGVEWSKEIDFNLKKDELAKVDLSTSDNKVSIRFRWTLYDLDKKLVMILWHNDFPRQYVLKKDWHLDSVRIPVFNDPPNRIDRSYAVIKFDDFDEKKRIAKIRFFLFDPEGRIK